MGNTHKQKLKQGEAKTGWLGAFDRLFGAPLDLYMKLEVVGFAVAASLALLALLFFALFGE